MTKLFLKRNIIEFRPHNIYNRNSSNSNYAEKEDYDDCCLNLLYTIFIKRSHDRSFNFFVVLNKEFGKMLIKDDVIFLKLILNQKYDDYKDVSYFQFNKIKFIEFLISIDFKEFEREMKILTMEIKLSKDVSVKWLENSMKNNLYVSIHH